MKYSLEGIKNKAEAIFRKAKKKEMGGDMKMRQIKLSIKISGTTDILTPQKREMRKLKCLKKLN